MKISTRGRYAVRLMLDLALNEDNTDEDNDIMLEKIPPIIARLRAMSPLWEDKIAAKKTAV